MTVMLRPAGLSRRGFVWTVAALLLAAPVPALAVTDQDSPKAFLDAIYQKYVGNAAQSAVGVTLDNAAAIQRYFSPGLARLMLEDDAGARKKNEVPALDGDPFVGHQDWDIRDLDVEVKQNGPKAVGTVTFTNDGKPEKVVLELVNVGSWRIADVQWPDGNTLRGRYRKK
jgi:hypothetical protein